MAAGAPRGSRNFLILWSGQMVSELGSGLTAFALGLWVYQTTGSLTQFALIALAATLPRALLAPLAGALTDRHNRRTILLWSDLGAGLNTLIMAALLLSGSLRVWHVWIAAAVSSGCLAFRAPAYSSALPLLVTHQRQLGRFNGLLQLSQAVAQLAAPVLAGLLVTSVGTGGVLLIDFLTFLAALTTLLSIRIPDHRRAAAGEAAGEAGRDEGWLRESMAGWRFIRERPGLLGLLGFSVAGNFLSGLITVLATPLILSFASPVVLGTLLSTGGSGLLVGSLVLSAWGGPRRRVHSILGFMAIEGLAMAAAGLRPSVVLVGVAAFSFFFAAPFVGGMTRALWQHKVPMDLQGRVFAVTGLFSWLALPLAQLSAGPLAERVFEPLMAVGGPLAGSAGRLLGTGPGRGIGLLFVTAGAAGLLLALAGYLSPRIRRVEDELPDAPRETPAAPGAVLPAMEKP